MGRSQQRSGRRILKKNTDMKKSAYLLIAFAFAAAVSCVKEIAVPQEPETCTLTAEFADGDVETRTSISSDNKTRWVLDDKILIKGSDATIITGTATSLQDNGRVAIFTMSKPVSGSGLYASYPSNLSYLIDGQNALWLSNTQNGSFAKANLSFGKINGSSIKFKHAAAIFRFNVSESIVDKVKIGCTSKCLGGFYIAPTFNSNGTIASIKELELPSNSLPITVSTPEPGAYYVAVRPGTYSANTIYFEFYDAAGNSILKYTYPKSLNAARGKLVDWGDISKKGDVPVLGVSLDKTSMDMELGTSKQLTATITPENATNKGLTWTSLNSNVATVDKNGLVTAWKEGTATINVNTKDGNKKASCTVTVKKVPVTNVYLDNTSLVLVAGENAQLNATVFPNNATDKSVTWTSSNTSVASVVDGKVTAKSAGSAIITAKSTDGNKTATCFVEVTLNGVFSVSLTKKVRFSRGNLQAKWQYVTNHYEYVYDFAAHQYDYIGKAPGNTTIGDQDNGAVVDLFGWSTYEYIGGINISNDGSDYSGDFYDWGKDIGDGSTWRTLARGEWRFIFDNRHNAEHLYKMKVNVCGIKNCLIIAPDDFSGTIQSSYDAATWAAAEAAGLVCLPPAGNRDGLKVVNVGDGGLYWSASPNKDDKDSAYRLSFTTETINYNSGYRYKGFSVRLVTDVK